MTQGTPITLLSVLDRGFLIGVDDVTQVIFVRHGEQQFGRPAELPPGERFDAPLSERGLRQAELAGGRLATEQVEAVYTSTIRRAYETATEIARPLGLEPRVVRDLREVELFHDLPASESVAELMSSNLMAGAYERWLRERRWDVFPYTESSFAFRERSVSAVEAIVAENRGKRIVIASHGGVINAYIGHILGLTIDMFFRPANASISVVHAGQGMRALQSLNDVAHLSTEAGNLVTF